MFSPADLVAIMAEYGAAENFYLLRRTVEGTFDFAGRSRRTEVVYFWIAASLVNAVAGFVASAILPWTPLLLFKLAASLLIFLPEFALFSRRLHDQDRSGSWAIILPVILILNVWRSVHFIIAASQDTFRAEPASSSIELWFGLPLAVAFVVLSFVPGTSGSNRYGPDPRL